MGLKLGVMVAALVFTFACGGNEAEPTSSPTGEVEPSTPTPTTIASSSTTEQRTASDTGVAQTSDTTTSSATTGGEVSPTFKEQQSAPETLQAFAEQILREEFRNFTISAPDVQSGPGQSSPSHKRTYYETNLAEGVKVTVEFGETPDGTFAGGFVLVDTQGAESGELADVLAIFERYFIVEDVQSRDWQPISFPNSPADGWEVATIRTDGSLHTWSSYSYCGTPGQGCQIGVAICVLYEGSETYDAKSCFLPE